MTEPLDDEALRAAVRAEIDAAVAPLVEQVARLTAELRARRRHRAPPAPIVEPEPEVRERPIPSAILYVGKSVDVGARMRGHERLRELARRWPSVVLVEPFVLAYKGEPGAVERALVARHGLPPWNTADVRPRLGPLADAGEVVGADDVFRLNFGRLDGIRGGYAIGIEGAAEDVEAAFAVLAEPPGFDFSWGST